MASSTGRAFLNYFFVASLLSLLLDAGLVWALRGAVVGMDAYLDELAQVAATFSQFSALAGSAILIFSMSATMAHHHRHWGVWPAAFLLFVVNYILVAAMQGGGGIVSLTVMALAAALVLLLFSALPGAPRALFIALLSAAFLGHALGQLGWPVEFTAPITGLCFALQTLAQTALLLLLARALFRRSALVLVLSFFLALLLAQASKVQSSQELPTLLLVLGRLVREVAGASGTALESQLPMSWLLVVASLSLFSRTTIEERLSTLSIVAVFLPLSPLSITIALASVSALCARHLLLAGDKAPQPEVTTMRQSMVMTSVAITNTR